MIKAIMHGCNGRMGQVISGLIKNDGDIELVAGIDRVTDKANDYPVFSSLRECDVQGDVIIDFSNAEGVEELLDYCRDREIPLVLCTTGLSESQLARVKETSQKVAILKSANMSFGINLLIKILKKEAGVLSKAGFDVEIVERHHRRKVDAPSGTAMALAEAANAAAGNQYDYVYDRSAVRQPRGDHEMGISAVRGGTIVGDHEVIFAGEDEVIELTHRAYSRAVFGKGAVEAAKFLAGKAPGMYDMSSVVL